MDLKYDLVFFALLFVVVCVANYVTAYARARGQSLATKADFDGLLSQVRQTTELTENIRRVVSHEDWQLREFKILRRVKLEELMFAVYEIHHWLDCEKDAALFGEANAMTDPFYRLDVFAGLYFPELTLEIIDLRAAYLEFRRWLNDCRRQILPLKWKVDLAGPEQNVNIAAHGAVLSQRADEYGNYYKPLLASTSAVEAKARMVMKELLGVES